MIDLTVQEAQVQKTVAICKEQGIVLPTYDQMRNPDLIPDGIKRDLEGIGLWDVDSKNLFRVSWYNEPKSHGGTYAGGNHIELPSSLTRTRARIVALTGKWFPTGAHKVGAAFGCLVPTLVTGQFDPSAHRAVWPSTGNYCRGGAYISRLLGCASIAILPEEMSKERFEWLKNMADETIATPGCESNVKEIFDKCWELRKTRGDKLFIFNQFEELGNHLWHWEVTGSAMERTVKSLMDENSVYAGACLSSGSGGTLASGEYMKSVFPQAKLAVAEALQCPTLLSNGFGGHRIEGIGDKHVPWIHNVKNTDMAIAVDDEHAMRLLRLFNEEVGREYLAERGVDRSVLDRLDLLGISGIGNMLSAIKFAKYYDLTEEDIVTTVFTDSFEMYESRLEEQTEEKGRYTRENAVADYELLRQIGTDNLLELSYAERKRIHHLKYYTWIEQQGKQLEELNAQWYDRNYWTNIHKLAPKLNRLIADFNERVRSA